MSANFSKFQLLIKLEKDLLQAEIRNTRKIVDELLADEFMEFCSSGRIAYKADTVESLSNETDFTVTADCFSPKELADDIVLLTYKSTNLQTGGVALRSSIWKFIDGRWQMIFHQGTKVPSER